MLSEEEVKEALDQYGNMVQRICFTHLKKHEDVDDVFQNVFFKYASSSPQFSCEEHKKAWFIRVTLNECNSFLRKWFKRKVVLKEDLSMYGFEEKPEYPEVLEAVLSLSPNLKSVIYLYYYEGYKITEIADILGKKENTIHTWLRRAKQQLKNMLGDDFNE